MEAGGAQFWASQTHILSKELLLRLLILLTLMLSIWSGPAAFARSSTTHTAAAKQGQVSDVQIQETIQAKLAKSKIGKDGFKFHVSHGVVTWEGTTGVMQHKGSATPMAKSAGATKVVNNIQVSASAKAKAAQQLKKAAVVEN